MKKLFKKNQVIITALALMIAAAGYLSYTYSGIGDDGLKQTSADLTEEDYDIVYDETPVEADIFTESEIDTQSDDESSKEFPYVRESHESCQRVIISSCRSMFCRITVFQR